MAINKLKQITILAIIKTGGTHTKSLEESVKTILQTHYPCDKPENYNSNETPIKVFSLEHPKTENDIPFEIDEIENLIKNIPTRVTPGPDNITTSIIKCLFRKHKELFHQILNGCLEYGYYPTIWKKSRTILIPKKSKPLDEANTYRPICINFFIFGKILGKILEKLINNRICYYLYTNKFLNQHKYGFMRGTSSTLALLKIKGIKENQSLNKKSILITLDIANAFNSIWIPHVLTQLKRIQTS